MLRCPHPAMMYYFPLKAVGALGLLVSSASAYSYGFPYGTEMVRGVSIGGWLNLEAWVTPSLFTNSGDIRIIDEWTFGQYQDPAKALQTLQNHWDTFITEQDFADIAAAGLNHVRLPIGYWIFDVAEGEPYVQGQLPYLYKAVEWSKNHHLKLFITIYGAPGSQNGFINSGHYVRTPAWTLNQTNIDRTTAIIQRLATMFEHQKDVVTIINPLNQPAGFLGDGVMNPTKKAFPHWKLRYPQVCEPALLPDTCFQPASNIRAANNTASRGHQHQRRNETTAMIITDGFLPLTYWDGFLTTPEYEGVFMSTYGYQVWTDNDIKLNQSAHISAACAKTTTLLTSPLPILVGEWGAPNTDCAQYMNGRTSGSRYAGTYPPGTSVYMGSCTGLTGNATTFSDDYKIFLRQFFETQVRAYEKAANAVGWFYWNWKMENADEWSYQAGMKYGWIPKYPADFKYPDLCI
ncbi:hypothetical protein D9619_001134 [Psilocybe cf. subviscida]|uniref:Glycoside hydrolase family 5 protein n=1 Tax=Psilocybe cf. subviscida TaxID=2480587 RepID=A0A8H5BE10_9AGAR|nr:hypothetical protein D9619_001134 [Psilocybe cf. subviscida]